MRIEKGQLICGYPAREIRKLMQKWPAAGDAQTILRNMRLSTEEAQGLLAALITEGFVEASPWGHEGTKYRRSLQGSSLAQASAAKPVRRAVAQKHLHELIERMCIVNEDSKFLVGVQEAVLFGSYLTPVDRLGDVDVSCKLFTKIEDQRTFVDMANASAQASGRHFRNIPEQACWPWLQVLLFLKNSSRVLSIRQNEGLLENPAVPRKLIFRNRKPVANWRKL